MAMATVAAPMFAPAASAEIVTGPAVAPLGTVIANEVDVLPAGITTEAGTVASLMLLLESVTVSGKASLLAPPFRVTVAIACPRATLMKPGAEIESAGPLVLKTLRVVVA